MRHVLVNQIFEILIEYQLPDLLMVVYCDVSYFMIMRIYTFLLLSSAPHAKYSAIIRIHSAINIVVYLKKHFENFLCSDKRFFNI